MSERTGQATTERTKFITDFVVSIVENQIIGGFLPTKCTIENLFFFLSFERKNLSRILVIGLKVKPEIFTNIIYLHPELNQS